MAIVVEHEKRKKEILLKAKEIFCDEGYDDVTFQKIADKCNITRTTLYIYFKNKREIFTGVIKQATSEMEHSLIKIMKRTDIDCVECLSEMYLYLLNSVETDGKFFKVLQPYLIQLEKGGDDINEKINKRILRLHHLTTAVIIRGQERGEINSDLPIREINSLFYGILESSVVRIAILNHKNLDSCRDIVHLVTSLLRSKK